jgi:hypothetical protein
MVNLLHYRCDVPAKLYSTHLVLMGAVPARLLGRLLQVLVLNRAARCL